jgi:hypothetical protein
MIYKLLMSVPSPEDGGVLPEPLDVRWEPLSSSDRALLAGMVQGKEMPYPGGSAQPLTTSQIDMLSAWIAQGATIPTGCP